MDSKEDKAVRIKLGNKLREAREKLGLTQVEVASKAKMTANYYAIIERGEGNLSFARLQRILKVLHITSLDV